MTDNQLAYIDQGSFLGLRALGHEPVQQLIWVYDHAPDMEALQTFHTNLGLGLLGRRIEKSPLPFGRDRWVVSPNQAGIDLAPVARSRAELGVWIDEQIALGVDPECGPAWRLAVLPFREGGAGITLTVSHSTCDGGGVILSATRAAKGLTLNLGYPREMSRTRRKAVFEDLASMAKALPDIARAVPAAIKLAREQADDKRQATATPAPARSSDSVTPVAVPSVAAFVELGKWDAVAQALGGTSNALVAGFGARLGRYRGRADETGRVVLTIPVSERGDADLRANALTGIDVKADSNTVASDLTVVRAQIREALAGLSGNQHRVMASLALTPLTPTRLLRKFDGVAAASELPVGCSNVGDMDPAVIRPDGTEAALFWGRVAEWPMTAAQLDRMGGVLMIAALRFGSKSALGVSGWQVGGVNNREGLAADVVRALGDFGLTATLE